MDSRTLQPDQRTSKEKVAWKDKEIGYQSKQPTQETICRFQDQQAFT